MDIDKTELEKSIADQKAKTKKTTILIISIVAGVLIIGSAIAYFVYKKAQDYKNQQIELTAEERQAAIENLFSVPEYNAIPEKYKEYIFHFLEYNGYLDGTYFLTKISDRAKNVFAFGDFTSDDNDEDDMAIILENSDFKSSRLVIFNHKGELLFVEDYENELPTINSYKVGSKIYMDELKLVPSPTDGLIVKNQYNKKAVVYDKKNKKFNTYYQYTKEEIEAMENESDYYDSYEADDVPAAVEVESEEFKIQEVK